ncbi:hypothetical protein GGX14DRAFT_432783 [Mycena pura]|uniref:Uncharacterized protein n=1 Tax=Mycena pura TaxID=153505 RepID=A0AAD6YH65_9AGAR|nr:hypothetical protein GGX14DRAFT_432783 [Mycena pura]
MKRIFILLFVLGFKIGGILWLRRLSVLRTYTYMGEDYPRVWPIEWPENQVLIPIHDTVRYQLDTNDGAAEWAASFPGNGMIYLGEQCRPFSISMFHQIRCLDTLRKAFVGVRSRNVSAASDGEVAIDWDLTQHCLNYLRQMVFCRGHPYLDPVLGYPVPNAHPDTDQCNDWGVVYDEVRRSGQRCGF